MSLDLLLVPVQPRNHVENADEIECLPFSEILLLPWVVIRSYVVVAKFLISRSFRKLDVVANCTLSSNGLNSALFRCISGLWNSCKFF